MRRALSLFLFAAISLMAEEASHAVSTPNRTATHETETGRATEGSDLMWKWVNFAILATGLGYIAVSKGGPFFTKRGQDILAGIKEAAKVKAEAETRAAEIEQRINKLGQEIEELRHASKLEMQAEGERIRTETAAEIAKVQARAEQEIASAAKLASQDLKAYAADLALELAEEQIRVRMDQPTEDALVQRFLKDLNQNKAAAN